MERVPLRLLFGKTPALPGSSRQVPKKPVKKRSPDSKPSTNPDIPKQYFSNDTLYTSYTFTWQVKRCGLIRPGLFQTSQVFQSGVDVPREWNLRFYPNGLKEPDPEDCHPFRISLVKRRGEPIPCKFWISVLCIRAGDLAFYMASDSYTEEKGPADCEEFILPRKEGRMFRDRDDDIPYTIRCKILLPEEDRVPYVTRMVDLANFGKHMMDLDLNSRTKDYTLHAMEGCSLSVHRCVIRARSSKHRFHLRLVDRTPSSIIREFPKKFWESNLMSHEYLPVRDSITYMYYGMTLSMPNIHRYLELNSMAIEYGINGLADLTLRCLRPLVTKKIVFLVLERSQQKSLKEVEKMALIFIAQNFHLMNEDVKERFKREFSQLQHEFARIKRITDNRREENLGLIRRRVLEEGLP